MSGKLGLLSEATQEKYDKIPVYTGFFARFPRAIRAVALVSRYGAKKHEVPMGDISYLDVPDAETVYLEAEGRHMVAEAIEGPIDLSEECKPLHKAEKAWNALADLEVYLRDNEG